MLRFFYIHKTDSQTYNQHAYTNTRTYTHTNTLKIPQTHNWNGSIIFQKVGQWLQALF